jgi:penicillin-binding protein 1A
LSKDEILELYVNRIYFGSGCYGIQTASQSYFGKDAGKLDLAESALLAGLIRSPNRFSPLKNPEGARIQRDIVLDRMVELKKISAAESQPAKREKINSHPRRLTLIQENYAMDAVQRDLNLLLTADEIDNGGLSIYTTLDPGGAGRRRTRSKKLTKIERQPGFSIRSNRNISRQLMVKTTPCHISRARWLRSTTTAAEFEPWSEGVTMPRANSIARFRLRIARSARRSSLSFIPSLSPMVCSRARR